MKINNESLHEKKRGTEGSGDEMRGEMENLLSKLDDSLIPQDFIDDTIEPNALTPERSSGTRKISKKN